jgi:hypothetical protein
MQEARPKQFFLALSVKKDEFTFHVLKFWKKETVCSGSGSGANWKVESRNCICKYSSNLD